MSISAPQLLFASLLTLLVACASQAQDENGDNASTEESTTTQAVDPDHPFPPDMTNPPHILFSELRKDFGEIWHAEKTHLEYEFVNTGVGDLVIYNARASCGCTQPTYPEAPIPPGDTGVIAVTYNSVGKEGFQRATIWVRTNDPENLQVQLKLTGRVNVKPKEEYMKELRGEKG